MIWSDPNTGVSFDDGIGAPVGYDPDLEVAIARSQEGAGGTGGGTGQGQPESVTYSTGPGFWGSVWEGVASVGSAVSAPVQGVLTGIEWTGKLLPVMLFGLGAVALYVMLPRSPGKR